VAIYSYRLSRGQVRWMFTIDLLPASDGKRRQMNRKGVLRQEDALAAKTKARKTYTRADLAADGSLAAELELWLGERELDVAETPWATTGTRAVLPRPARGVPAGLHAEQPDHPRRASGGSGLGLTIAR